MARKEIEPRDSSHILAKKGKPSIGPEVTAYLKEFTGGNTSNLSETEIQNRVVARWVNEAAAMCLQDEIIENPVCGDIGLVFGIGFAPFRRRSVQIPRQCGHVVICRYDEWLSRQKAKGAQFEPCQLLKDYAACGCCWITLNLLRHIL